MNEHIKRVYNEPEKIADEVAERVIGIIGKPKPIQQIRNSQIASAIVATAGLALFLVGVEKVFSFLSGWHSILLGVLLLALSGALFTKLR
jgi:hypothetical protein